MMSDSTGPRHLAILGITPDVLLFIDSATFRVERDGLPEDVSIVGRGYDPERDVFYLILNHPSFQPVVPGSHIPWLPPITIKRIPE